MSKRLFFISLISRDNRPLHIQPIAPFKGPETILSERVDDQTSEQQNDTTESEPKEKTKTNTELVQDINNDQILKYHFLSNMALDIFLSPFYENEQGIPSLLFVQDGINVYGYETNTGLKILVGTPLEIDQSFEFIFKKLHKLYLDIIINPFQNDDLSKIKINPVTTTNKINQIIQDWNNFYQIN